SDSSIMNPYTSITVLLHLYYLFSFLNSLILSVFIIFFFFFNDTATTEIYTLSLHDALPIYFFGGRDPGIYVVNGIRIARTGAFLDRKSTRLNSSHVAISYAVFCLKKKKKKKIIQKYNI